MKKKSNRTAETTTIERVESGGPGKNGEKEYTEKNKKGGIEKELKGGKKKKTENGRWVLQMKWNCK